MLYFFLFFKMLTEHGLFRGSTTGVTAVPSVDRSLPPSVVRSTAVGSQSSNVDRSIVSNSSVVLTPDSGVTLSSRSGSTVQQTYSTGVIPTDVIQSKVRYLFNFKILKSICNIAINYTIKIL